MTISRLERKNLQVNGIPFCKSVRQNKLRMQKVKKIYLIIKALYHSTCVHLRIF